MRKACSVVRVCAKARLTEIVALRRLTLHDVTWAHDKNQVAMLVGCRLPVNIVEVDSSAGLDVDSASALGFAPSFAVRHGWQEC